MDNAERPEILLLGAGGQVGWELVRTLAPLGNVHTVGRTLLDLSDLDAVRQALLGRRVDVIVNAAAYTAVDRAESEPALARRVNGEMPGVLAEHVARSGGLLIHFSTDYVFDGTATRPYTEDDGPNPRSSYGASKLLGDESVVASGADAYVFRVGWVYGSRGRNFLTTVQRLAREQAELAVVADQHGAPTWSRAIAEPAAHAVGQWLAARRAGYDAAPAGVYHMAAPDHTTWYDFASAIVAMTPTKEGQGFPTVRSISTAEYPTAAVRPRWSVLNSEKLREAFGLALPPWREQLAHCVDEAS